MNEIFTRIKQRFFIDKNYSAINVLGLSVGIACVLVIMLWVEDELKFDAFNKNADRIYRVITEEEGWSGTNSAMTARPLANTLKEKLPEIEKVANFEMEWEVVVNVGENAYSEDGLTVVSEDFFKMFSFPFLEGGPQPMFQDKYTVAISEKIAKKYFGDDDAIGKHFKINKKLVKVVAVFKDIDYNSHIRFDMAISTGVSHDIFNSDNNWNNQCLYTYIQLAKNTNQKLLAQKLYTFLSDHVDKENEDHYLMQPLKEIHFKKGLSDEDYTYLGDKQYVYIFSFLGLLILILACVNYINLSTAISEKSIKENGVRKILGASKSQLIRISLIKSMITSIVATGIAVVILYMVIPSFNSFTQKDLSLNFTNPLNVLTLLIIPLFTGLLSGFYPALYNASFSPINIGRKNKLGSNNWLRRGLVVLQFSFSIGLIVATLVSFKQLHHIRQMNLGFDKDHTIYFYLDVNESGYQTIKNRILKIPGIEMVAGKGYYSSTVMNSSEVRWPGNEEGKIFVHNQIDEDFFSLLRVNFIEGENFTKELKTKNQQGVIINKKAKEIIGNDNPIGMNLRLWGRQFQIIGVIDNVHFWSLNENIHPEFYIYSNAPRYFFVRFRNSPNISTQQLVRQIKSITTEMYPSEPFEYVFLDATYARLYDNDKRVGTIFGIVAIIAIFISCMGLFGLTLYSSENRIKEIGVRKVNGAKISEILILLNMDFVKWVVIAFTITTPVAFLVLQKWLNNFAYKTNLSWWIFALSGLLALGIALLTVSWQSWRAATRNPVEALRYE